MHMELPQRSMAYLPMSYLNAFPPHASGNLDLGKPILLLFLSQHTHTHTHNAMDNHSGPRAHFLQDSVYLPRINLALLTDKT